MNVAREIRHRFERPRVHGGDDHERVRFVTEFGIQQRAIVECEHILAVADVLFVVAGFGVDHRDLVAESRAQMENTAIGIVVVFRIPTAHLHESQQVHEEIAEVSGTGRDRVIELLGLAREYRAVQIIAIHFIERVEVRWDVFVRLPAAFESCVDAQDAETVETRGKAERRARTEIGDLRIIEIQG